MPSLAVFAASAKRRLRINASHLQPRQPVRLEPCKRDPAHPAITIHISRIIAVELQVFAMDEEERHARSVFAVVEHLFDDVTAAVEFHWRAFEDGVAARYHVQPVDCAGVSPAEIPVENLRVALRAAETRPDRAADGLRQLAP